MMARLKKLEDENRRRKKIPLSQDSCPDGLFGGVLLNLEPHNVLC